ncbi:MAG TPA: extracellular solute-binding protein [Candidatus Gastranaerophilaceae bacterium]|nr:extracellular solute-binding protein [Candidatus Gastranaerophilaceae bacterium]
MKKNIVRVLIILVIGAIFLLAKKSPKENQLVFWTLQMGDFAPYMNGVITEFEKQNPEIKIKWVDVPFSEGEKRTLAAILSDNPPDLINLNPDFSAILAQKGALKEINESNTGQFNSEIINSLKYKGKLYALPWYATSAITIYNRGLYKKSGVKLFPRNYREIWTIAPDIKEKTGAYVFMPTITENDTMLKILNKYGVNSAGKINSQAAVDVFDFYKELYRRNLIPKETITQTQREVLEKYMSNQIVFFQAGANFLNMIKENAPSTYKNTDVSSQFTGALGQYDFSLMNLVIPLKSSKKEDALKFALFLTNDENQLKLAKLTNVLATNKKTLRNEFYTKYDENDLMSKARVISARQLNRVQPVLRQGKGQKEINLLINTAVQEILLEKQDTKTILDDVAKKWKLISD